MAKNKENKTADVLDVPVQDTKTKVDGSETASKIDFESFFDKNKKFIFGFFILILLAGAGYAGYTYMAGTQDEEAQKEMFVAENYFQMDSFNLALKGDKVNRGFIDLADEYSLSKSATLCNFYIGVIYLKQGKYEDAIEYLKKFNAGDLLIQARAYSLIGDAYLELKDNENAVSYYSKAADYEVNEYFTPRYLMKLGMACEISNDFDGAAKAYGKIVDNYSKASEYNDARKYKARAEAMKE